MKKRLTALILTAALTTLPCTASFARGGGGHGGGGGGGYHGGGGGYHGGGGGYHGGGGWHGGYGGWHSGFRGGIIIGDPFWYPWYPYAAYPYPYYGPYRRPPVVVEQGPSVYVEQPQQQGAQTSDGYWYYCESARGYYPNIPTCPEAWVKVPPQSR